MAESEEEEEEEKKKMTSSSREAEPRSSPDPQSESLHGSELARAGYFGLPAKFFFLPLAVGDDGGGGTPWLQPCTCRLGLSVWVSDWVCLASEPVVRPSPDLPDRPNSAKRSKTPGTGSRDAAAGVLENVAGMSPPRRRDAASAVVRRDTQSQRAACFARLRLAAGALRIFVLMSYASRARC